MDIMEGYVHVLGSSAVHIITLVGVRVEMVENRRNMLQFSLLHV
jgi:hypothetical protein